MKAEKPTELLVVGTIHQQHWAVPGYSPRVLEAILDKADPDALCLEIRPVDVERGKLYAPPEMEAVGIKWARAHNRPWYPIDWFPDSNVRQERAKAWKALSETPEGRAKLEQIEEFGMERAIVDAARSWPAAMELDYRKVNSPEFCDLQRAG